MLVGVGDEDWRTGRIGRRDQRVGLDDPADGCGFELSWKSYQYQPAFGGWERTGKAEASQDGDEGTEEHGAGSPTIVRSAKGCRMLIN
jgi:hypothetical protein